MCIYIEYSKWDFCGPKQTGLRPPTIGTTRSALLLIVLVSLWIPESRIMSFQHHQVCPQMAHSVLVFLSQDNMRWVERPKVRDLAEPGIRHHRASWQVAFAPGLFLVSIQRLSRVPLRRPVRSVGHWWQAVCRGESCFSTFSWWPSDGQRACRRCGGQCQCLQWTVSQLSVSDCILKHFALLFAESITCTEAVVPAAANQQTGNPVVAHLIDEADYIYSRASLLTSSSASSMQSPPSGASLINGQVLTA